MNASWYDVAVWLDANSSLTLATDLFGGEWGKPDKQIMVKGGESIPSDLKDVYEQVGIQIMSRGRRGQDPNSVNSALYDVVNLLLTSGERIEMNGCEYSGFELSSNISDLGMDENQRHHSSVNLFSYRKGAM